MNSSAVENENIYITAPEVVRRYHITSMTLHRWLKDDGLNFPRPMVVRKRRLFVAAELDAFDEQQRAAR
ncbi:putative DNA-binding transcriptional regulator AlpA [Agrobacterium rubi]|nr:putative DNA-binding transcriptional regulator AlpA [Agrobacterium rubi]